MANRKEVEEAEALILRVLEAVENGVLEAQSASARRMVRRLEGASSALRAWPRSESVGGAVQ